MRFESPTASWPRARPIEGGGTRISGTYVQPWLADAMPVLFGLIVLVHSGLVLAGTANIIAAAVWGAFMALLCPVLWKRSLTNMLGKIVDVRVHPDRIQIRQGFFRRNYDRRIPISFGIETRRPEYDVEVVMRYGERRIVIAIMPVADIGRAEALLARLQEATEDVTPAASLSALERRRPRAYSPYSSAAHLYG